MNLVEEIISQHTGHSVRAGDVVTLEPDLVMIHDGNTPLFMNYFENRRIKYPDRVVAFTDHFSPPSSIAHSEVVRAYHRFLKEQGIEKQHHFTGIGHQLMVELGYAGEGMIILGNDTHATTYGAVGAFGFALGNTDTAYTLATGRTTIRVPKAEVIGLKGRLRKASPFDVGLEVIRRYGTDGGEYRSLEFQSDSLSLDGRMTVSNLSAETGAVSAIFSRRKENAAQEIDLAELTPLVALTYSPDNIAEASSLKDVRIQQAMIGSCASGRLEDIRTAAEILNGEKIDRDVRLIVAPSSNGVMLKAAEEGYIQTLIEAGAVVVSPGCGSCAGIDRGILASGERAVATYSRNYRGRMGPPDSGVYLASPETVALSALYGEITGRE